MFLPDGLEYLAGEGKDGNAVNFCQDGCSGLMEDGLVTGVGDSLGQPALHESAGQIGLDVALPGTSRRLGDSVESLFTEEAQGSIIGIC